MEHVKRLVLVPEHMAATSNCTSPRNRFRHARYYATTRHSYRCTGKDVRPKSPTLASVL